jgi:hypothetical protein
MVAVILSINGTFLETRNLFVVQHHGWFTEFCMCIYMVRGDTSQRLPICALERVKTPPYKIGRGYASRAGLRSDVDSIKRLLHRCCDPEHQRHFFGDA